MSNYRVVNRDGREFEITEQEAWNVAEKWVDDFNNWEIEFGENDNDHMWEHPSNIGQVREIFIEYMQCLEFEEVEKYERETEELYEAITSSFIDFM